MNEEIESTLGSELAEQIEAVNRLIQGGNYEAATTVARELLSAYPDSARLYTTLGDIYAARRMWPEAVEWYHDAVQHGDNSAGDKLADARTQLAGQLPTSRAPSASALERQRTKLWIMLASTGAVVVIAAVIAWLTLFSSPPRISRASDQAASQGATIERSAAGYAIGQSRALGPGAMPLSPPTTTEVAPRPRSPAPDTEREQRGAPIVTSRPTPPVPQPTSVTEAIERGPCTERDLVLAGAIGSLSWPNGTTMHNDVAVALDTYTGYAMITFQIPDSLQAGNLYSTVLRQSYSIAAAAINTDPSVNYVTLRGLFDLSSSTRKSRNVVACRGNTSRESLEYWLKLGTPPTEQQLWTEAFADTWWNPNIPRSGEG